jgi:hypothetical protein
MPANLIVILIFILVLFVIAMLRVRAASHIDITVKLVPPTFTIRVSRHGQDEPPVRPDFAYHSAMTPPQRKSGRFAEWQALRRERQEARNAELDRQDREAAERLHSIKPPPLFSAAAVDGACPNCGGRQFQTHEGVSSLGAFLVGGVVGAVVAAAANSNEGIECLTCGERFSKG